MLFESYTNMTYEVYRKFNLFTILFSKTSNLVVYIIWMVISIFAIPAFFIKLFTAPERISAGIAIYIFAFLFVFLILWIPFVIKRAYKKSALLYQNPIHNLFYEEHFSVIYNSPLCSGENMVRYEGLTGISETKDCFYLYINKIQAYVITKSGITQGTPEQLSAFLSQKVGYKFKKR